MPQQLLMLISARLHILLFHSAQRHRHFWVWTKKVSKQLMSINIYNSQNSIIPFPPHETTKYNTNNNFIVRFPNTLAPASSCHEPDQYFHFYVAEKSPMFQKLVYNFDLWLEMQNDANRCNADVTFCRLMPSTSFQPTFSTHQGFLR